MSSSDICSPPPSVSTVTPPMVAAVKQSQQSQSQAMACLVCGERVAKGAFMAHVAEHLNYRQHACTGCAFNAYSAEEMADHEAETEHVGQLYGLRNAYLDRLLRFVYNDCDFGERNGGSLDKVLQRRLLDPGSNGNAVKAEDSGTLKVGGVEVRTQVVPGGPWVVHHQQTPQPQQQQFYVQSPSTTNQKLEQLLQLGGAGGGATPAGVQQHPAASAFSPSVADAVHFLEQVDGVDGTQSNGTGHPQFNAQHGQNIAPPHFDGVMDQYIHPDSHQQPKGKKGKPSKDQFENVQCLKCGHWVKGRGICLLYHMNTRHLKFPLYRCLACPRDFFYVTDTTAKNHIRSFHGNDTSLLQNNYHTYSRLLHDSRRDFFGAALRGCEGRKIQTTRKLRGKQARGAAVTAQPHGTKLRRSQQQTSPASKTISIRDRPQSGSGPAGSSSHVQCLQCGEFVASIYSSQLSHINTKHLHLAVYSCRICGRPFESLSSSAAVMHIKSMHGTHGRAEAEAQFVDQRDACLKELNERYRAYFN